ncbi:MAG: hypothetical protein ATN31_10555 [Candidatus Epulonipiscioides saccharophilum]|nr:MAG: hypothetical protein ATN31_10555 [Epulopiscium sp. AS2M-Bin001]
MSNEIIKTLHKLYVSNTSFFKNKSQLSTLLKRHVNDDYTYKTVLLEAVDLNVATLIFNNVKSISDVKTINSIKEKLTLTWREDLADHVIDIFIQTKFGIIERPKPSHKLLFEKPDIQINYDNRIFDIIDGVLTKFKGYNERVIIPQGVIAIGEKAFYHSTHLLSVTIPKGVVNIGKFAFAQCTNLSEIIIPEGVDTIEDCAFAWCSSLQTVVIQKDGNIIGKSAFMECSNLKTVQIFEGVQTIDKCVFAWCDKLEFIELPSSLKYICDEKVLLSASIVRSGPIWDLLTTIK